MNMKLRIILITLMTIHVVAFAADGKKSYEQAALLYKAYINCVAENSYKFSSGPDSASDIAVASFQACEKLEQQAYEESMKYARTSPDDDDHSRLTIPTLDRLRAYVQETARKVAISVVIRNRAD